MLSGWVLATLHFPQNLANAHPLHFQQGILSWFVACRKNLPVNVTPFLKRGNYKEIFRKFVSQLQASSPFCPYQPNSQFISIYIYNNARRCLTME
jgi:hypothetical protein